MKKKKKKLFDLLVNSDNLNEIIANDISEYNSAVTEYVKLEAKRLENTRKNAEKKARKSYKQSINADMQKITEEMKQNEIKLEYFRSEVNEQLQLHSPDDELSCDTVSCPLYFLKDDTGVDQQNQIYSFIKKKVSNETIEFLDSDFRQYIDKMIQNLNLREKYSVAKGKGEARAKKCDGKNNEEKEELKVFFDHNTILDVSYMSKFEIVEDDVKEQDDVKVEEIASVEHASSSLIENISIDNSELSELTAYTRQCEDSIHSKGFDIGMFIVLCCSVCALPDDLFLVIVIVLFMMYVYCSESNILIYFVLLM